MTVEPFPVLSPGVGYLRSLLAWQTMFAENLMQVQRSQFDMAMAWQKSLRAV